MNITYKKTIGTVLLVTECDQSHYTSKEAVKINLFPKKNNMEDLFVHCTIEEQRKAINYSLNYSDPITKDLRANYFKTKNVCNFVRLFQFLIEGDELDYGTTEKTALEIKSAFDIMEKTLLYHYILLRGI